MKIAIISDIHSNLPALNAVMTDIKTQSVDFCICLGDIVGYGASPNECIDVIKNTSDIVLAGNHDYASCDKLGSGNFNEYAKKAIIWTKSVLTKSNNDYLFNLELAYIKENATFVHASPQTPNLWKYITTVNQATECFSHFSNQICFVGHTHVSYAISINSKGNTDVLSGENFILNKLNKYIVNIGSVGQPRDKNNNSSYAIYDSKINLVALRRVQYDILLAQQNIIQAGLPSFLAERLIKGK